MSLKLQNTIFTMQSHRTLMPPISFPFSINYSKTLIFLGSCFSENIGNICKQYGFNTIVNPFHIIYNPTSLAKQVKYLLTDSSIDENLFLHIQNTTFHYDFHSKLNAIDIATFKETINSRKIAFFDKNIKDPIIFLTLGTSWVYQLDHHKIVANCHKQSNKLFEKRLLSIDEIISSLNKTKLAIHNHWPQSNIVLTISPVRHLKDGFIENQRSKSRLIEAVHHVSSTELNIHYFPSYEIVMDDLRDYRYYNRDMVHPSDLSIDYIWEYFKNSLLDKKIQDLARRANAIYKRKKHKFLNLYPEQYERFVQKTRLLEEELLKENSDINLKFID